MATILVVEDDEETLKLVEIMIQRGAYEVHKAAKADEALSILDRSTPDLIMLDIMLPVMDGITLCKAIRDRAETRETPILVLTAKSDPLSIQQSLAAGANEYVIKPISFKDLLGKIANLLVVPEREVNPHG